jgi:hypothetical protein
MFVKKNENLTPKGNILLYQLKTGWEHFKKDLEKIWMDPRLQEESGKQIVEEILKPNLQKVLDSLLDEDSEKRETHTIGECLEFTLKEGLFMELVAYGKSDRPEGLFEIVLKFINYIILDVQATHLLNMQEIHPAVMQLLVHIEYSIRNNMLL